MASGYSALFRRPANQVIIAGTYTSTSVLFAPTCSRKVELTFRIYEFVITYTKLREHFKWQATLVPRLQSQSKQVSLSQYGVILLVTRQGFYKFKIST